MKKIFFTLILASTFTVNSAIAEQQVTTSQAPETIGMPAGKTKKMDPALMKGLPKDQTRALLEMQKLMQELNKDPKFKAIMKEANTLAKKMKSCKKLRSPPDISACKKQYNQKYRQLMIRAGELKDKKLEPIRKQLDALQNKPAQ